MGATGPRIVRVEVQAAERLPAAMLTAFDVAARAMALADGRAAIRAAGFEATVAGSAPACVAPAAGATPRLTRLGRRLRGWTVSVNGEHEAKK